MSKSMSLQERKGAIKLSSNVAMASSRRGSKWSRALINQLSMEPSSKLMVKSILGDEQRKMLAKPANTNNGFVKNSKMSTKSCMVHSGKPRKSLMLRTASALTMAKNLQEKRMKLLKCAVPGGESMDELCLLEETADYIFSLRAQIDVMRHLAMFFQQI